jgi:hypothetical protein
VGEFDAVDDGIGELDELLITTPAITDTNTTTPEPGAVRAPAGSQGR